MSLSTFDLLKVGIGPSSSHTVGPMHAAQMYAVALSDTGSLNRCYRVNTELFGSLGATGAGHGSPKAIILGLEGDVSDTADIDGIEARVAAARKHGSLILLGIHQIAFDCHDDLVMHRTETLPFHANGMRCMAYDEQGETLQTRVY